MTRIGITGHSNLSADSVPLVHQALVEVLAPHKSGDLVGVSCLARGADQIFAEVVLEAGGRLEVVLPSVDYREAKVKPYNLDQFDDLPGEVFVELGLAIKLACPFKTTIVMELCNDSPAYVPTKKAFAEGSYETVNSRVQSGGGEMLVDTAVKLLKELHTK